MSEKRVTEIQARRDAAGDGRRMDLGEGWQAHEDRGVLLALRRAPVTAAQAFDGPLYVPAAGCDNCGNAPGERHAVGCEPRVAAVPDVRDATSARIAALTGEARHEAMQRASRSYSAPQGAIRFDGCRVDGNELVWPDGERWPIGPDALDRLRGA